MSLTPPPGTLGTPQTKPTGPAINRTEITPPKCFGTDYYGKWNQTGMTFESMKIDRPDYQLKCANCPFFEKCYMLNHIRILRIKR
jgi:hypothetical protein